MNQRTLDWHHPKDVAISSLPNQATSSAFAAQLSTIGLQSEPDQYERRFHPSDSAASCEAVDSV
jgi:hypothetical protein